MTGPGQNNLPTLQPGLGEHRGEILRRGPRKGTLGAVETGQRPQRRDRGRHHHELALVVPLGSLIGPDPHGPISFGGGVTGALPLGQGGDEEPGVVPPGLELGRDPPRPGTQQIGPQNQPAPPEELAERQLPPDERLPVGLPGLPGRVPHHGRRVGPGEQHARLLVRLPHGGTHDRLRRLLVHAEPRRPRRTRGPAPPHDRLVVTGIHAPARIRVRAPAKAMEARRRSMCTSGPATASRRSMTVAARRGTAAASSPAASARIRSGHSGDTTAHSPWPEAIRYQADVREPQTIKYDTAPNNPRPAAIPERAGPKNHPPPRSRTRDNRTDKSPTGRQPHTREPDGRMTHRSAAAYET